DPKKAPDILRSVAANDAELKENIIRTITRSKPRDIFGELQTEEFYLADRRSERATEVAKQLNEILLPYGVIVERVGTGDYRFNPEYSKAIEERKVADQDTEKAKSETRATEKEYLTKVEIAKGEVARVKAKADGEFERAKIEADAEFEKQKQTAEAIRAEGVAEAEAIRKMDAALAGPGGDAVVKLAIIDALKGKHIVSVPMGAGIDLRSLDMNKFLETIQAPNVARPDASATPQN
ncbi:MAG: prohibitin family protein, partial [Candidatus Hydrogenedentes bacterium]|nr:prohibitin family protein [Candidatus Hydrogenedentota bacterium]